MVMIALIKSLINKFKNKNKDPIILDRMSSGLIYSCVVCNKDMISNSKINYLACSNCKIAFKNKNILKKSSI
jgi:DNA-directed RNA polymerase subunit RPC12/RpoP